MMNLRGSWQLVVSDITIDSVVILRVFAERLHEMPANFWTGFILDFIFLFVLSALTCTRWSLVEENPFLSTLLDEYLFETWIWIVCLYIVYLKVINLLDIAQKWFFIENLNRVSNYRNSYKLFILSNSHENLLRLHFDINSVCTLEMCVPCTLCIDITIFITWVCIHAAIRLNADF